VVVQRHLLNHLRHGRFSPILHSRAVGDRGGTP
jgi:hypothetical protein